MGDGRTLRATGSAGSFVTAWLLEPTVNSTCVLAVTASWSVRVYVAARETHGRVCPLCYLLPVVALERSLLRPENNKYTFRKKKKRRLLFVRAFLRYMVRPSPASPRLSRSAMPSHIASSVFLSRSGTDRPRRGRACRATRGGVGRMGSKHKKNKAKKTQSK